MTLDDATPETEVVEVAELSPSEFVEQLEPVSADNLRSAVEAGRQAYREKTTAPAGDGENI